MRVKTQLKQIASYSKGSQINGDKLVVSGAYDYLNGGVAPSGKWDEFNTPGGTVTISEGGNSCGYVNYMREPFWCGAHCYYLFDTIRNSEYLYYALKSQQERLMGIRTGACMPNIKKADLGRFEITYDTDEQQQEYVVSVLSKVESIIAARQQELNNLDNLIKARFVEMFGDPISNDYGWNTAPLENVCKTIVDCPHSTPSYTNVDTGYMCIRTSIVKKNRIMWDEIEYIPEHEYNKRIQRKRPEKGDIVYTREGAILGIAAIIDRECNVALGQRSMLLSPDTTRCLPQFLCVAMNFDTFLRKALKGLSGSASPHINVGDIKAFTIIVPPIDLQNQFAAFAEQVGKSKVVVQKALDEAQTLFDSLMQEYFG